MAVINLLDKQTANLIAAGEVVDRPAAVAKELLENAIDAGGTSVVIEIKNGGSSLIRVTDNGKGMAAEDVQNCVLRHATSKIKNPEDLEGISTLGFRGEALAAISAVSRFQVISKEKDALLGTLKSMEGEKTVAFDEVGCPDGTTVTVRDIFFNVPARRKFLKKDATETAYIAQYVERIALSHPEIAIKFIVDGRVRFSTQGNGVLSDTIYAIFGREFVESLMPVERNDDKLSVSGFVSLPERSAINRNHQIIFVNNRLVRSRIVSYAIEDAYKSYIMTDRYPSFIVFLSLNPHLVDINVHPSKLEVRFVDESAVREAVYFAVKNSLEDRTNVIKEDYIRKSNEQIVKSTLLNAFVPMEKASEAPKQQEISLPLSFDFAEAKPVSEEKNVVDLKPIVVDAKPEAETNFVTFEKISYDESGEAKQSFTLRDSENPTKLRDEAESFIGTFEEKTVPVTKVASYKGIVFNTYIIAEYEDNMYIIDKHAAHERIIYESLKKNMSNGSVQSLIATHPINLSRVQFETAMDNIDDIKSCGFDIEAFGDDSLVLRGVPTEFSDFDVSDTEKILVDMIDDISVGKSAKNTKNEILDRSLYTVACKAATKAGYKDDEKSYIWLINKLFELDNLFCCPHGRPLIVKYTKSQIEKMFFRT